MKVGSWKLAIDSYNVYMFPTLFTLGAFSLKTIVLFILFAAFIAAFIFWKKGKEEHYNEFELMDAFFQSIFIGLLAGRVGYIIHAFPTIGFNLLSWLDFVTHPGIHGLTTILVTGFALYKIALRKKWDAFEILDFWVIAIAYMLSILYVGLFFDGTYYGSQTELPIGVLFPGLFVKHHPLQLYLSLLFFIIAFYLTKVEYRYRTFEWYRDHKKAAQTGFLLCVFMIYSALMLLITSFFRPTTMIIPYLDQIEYTIVLLAGIALLWNRSGRSFGRK